MKNMEDNLNQELHDLEKSTDALYYSYEKCRAPHRGYRQAVMKLKIKGVGIPHMVSGKDMRTAYCVPLMPNFYFVTACRVARPAALCDRYLLT